MIVLAGFTLVDPLVGVVLVIVGGFPTVNLKLVTAKGLPAVSVMLPVCSISLYLL